MKFQRYRGHTANVVSAVSKHSASLTVLADMIWVVACLALLYYSGAVTASPLPGDRNSAEYDGDWRSVQALVDARKLEVASARVAEIREAAREDGDLETWTRGLVEEVRLRTALHGYETAVKFLREQPWPDEPLWQSVLDLYYAQSLVSYFQRYSYEIRGREHVVSDDELDLKSWTTDQIVHEAHRAYQRAWSKREDWGIRSLDDMSLYIDQNDYPARIRGTLRDAVTYMWMDLLADKSFWRPRHANETFMLDKEALILGGRDVDIDPTDPDVHPLRRLCAVLDDHEGWHLRRGSREAALECRLVRLRVLSASCDHDLDKLAIIDHLSKVLDQLDDGFDWWSMGQWQLAEFLQRGPGENPKAAAYRAAVNGRDRHPNSFGGLRCAHLAAKLKAPEYSLHAMSVDAAHKRSIQITHRNLERLYFRAWRYDLADRIEKSERHTSPRPRRDEIQAWTHELEPDLVWRVDLPPTVDLESHRTFTTLPAEEPGAYIVMASARQDFKDRRNQLAAVDILVSDLVLVARDLGGEMELSALSGTTGEHLGDVAIDVYSFPRNEDQPRIRNLITKADGLARVENEERHARYLVFARLGENLAIIENFNTRQVRYPNERTHSFVYTDRSVYRPGQTLHWKVIAYRGGGPEPRYLTLPDTRIIVTLRDGNHREMAADTLNTNSFGSASGSFVVPRGRLLGNWSVNCSLRGNASVKVEEYKRPTFEVTIDDPVSPLRLNQPATLGGQVEYYFGLPLTSGDMAWRITRRPRWPRWWWWQPPAGEVQTVKSGRTTLGTDGTFEVAFTPQADERLSDEEDVVYDYELSVEVTDDGGETRSASRNFRIGFVSVIADITSAVGFGQTDTTYKLDVTLTSLDGAARPGEGEWWVVELEQPTWAILPADQPVPFPPGDEDPDRTAGDTMQPRWQTSISAERTLARWPDGPRREDGTLEHGEDGVGRIDLSGLAAGAYRLHYETIDDFGTTCRARHDFLIAGRPAMPLALPLLLRAEQTVVAVGDTLRLIAHSGLKHQDMVLELSRNGKRYERRTLSTDREGGLIEFPIILEQRGGFSATLTALRDHQLMKSTVNIFVPWDDRRLEIEFATFRDRLRPGTDETFRVTVRNANGRFDEDLAAAGATELLAYMYDRSLDIFAGHNAPRPLTLYPLNTTSLEMGASLGNRRGFRTGGRGFSPTLVFPSLHGDRLHRLSGYGVGGMGRRGGGSDFEIAHSIISDGIEIPVMNPFEVEGARYMVEVKNAATAMRFGGDQLQDYAIDSVEEAVSKQAGVQMRDGDLYVGGGRSGDVTMDIDGTSVEPRTNFAETAFFAPHLLLDDEGAAIIEFKVPDSVTEWNVWVHALTRDLRSGSAHETTASVKELMVRPYLPRFLREGDRAELKVVVNNAGESALTGKLDFELYDPDTEADLRGEFGLDESATRGVPFTVEAGGGTDLVFPITAPARVGPVVCRVTARAGDYADGEQRSLPVLPGRMHLMQSRFASLQEGEQRKLHFSDMPDDDPTRIDEQLVVTVDAQLFYSVLNATPYLVDYPYECTEQLLNKFLSTGILTSLFDGYPAVARMARQMSARDTRLEVWEGDDPNRKLLLEETPWLRRAEGGLDTDDLIKVLDPEIARATREASLAKLEKAQDRSGGFPWWPGGEPSPYLTLYILHGFAKSLEFGVDVPRDMIINAWRYMRTEHYDTRIDEYLDKGCCWETITFLNYVLSCYPDESWTGGVFSSDDRARMLDFSFDHWKRHAPLLKGYLTLTLTRDGRGDDARLVFDSIMDSARTEQDLGTYWAPEDRAWLWYNDTIETHAFALRVMTELLPDDARRHGLVQWLLLNKKLNHWSSTRATAEVIYALVHYMEAEGALGARETVDVTIGPRAETFVFEPDAYTGARNRVIVPGDALDPATMATVVVEKGGKGTAFASATWHFSTERMPETAEGDLFAVERSYFRRHNDGDEWVLTPLRAGDRVAVGDQVEVQLSVSARHAAEFVHLRDPRGAGFEPESTRSGHRWDQGLRYYEEVRDSGANFFFSRLPAGQYTLRYRLRANMAGEFKAGPAVLQSMYAPEFTAYSTGRVLGVE